MDWNGKDTFGRSLRQSRRRVLEKDLHVHDCDASAVVDRALLRVVVARNDHALHARQAH